MCYETMNEPLPFTQISIIKHLRRTEENVITNILYQQNNVQ